LCIAHNFSLKLTVGSLESFNLSYHRLVIESFGGNGLSSPAVVSCGCFRQSHSWMQKMLAIIHNVSERESMHSRLAFAIVLFTAVASAAAAQTNKPVFLYSRYFNAPGEARYQPDGTYKALLTRLQSEFTVRANSERLNDTTLRDVDLVLIANPSDKAVGTNAAPHRVDARDIEELTRFVERGGGLIVMGNQENHNLEIEHMNHLLQRFGMQFTNLYTDAKLLPLPRNQPIVGGLNWAYYTGNLVLLDEAHSAKPHALVMNDLTIKPPKGNRDQAGALMAASLPGKGHVVVVTDAGWLTSDVFEDKGIGGVVLMPHDNYEIFRRLAHWAAAAQPSKL
jgi:hypothetical protein